MSKLTEDEKVLLLDKYLDLKNKDLMYCSRIYKKKTKGVNYEDTKELFKQIKTKNRENMEQKVPDILLNSETILEE